ncbi:MAG: hypothetical protein AB7P14_18620 [Blastocatellales bacterium]
MSPLWVCVFRLLNIICLAMFIATLGLGGIRVLRAAYVISHYPQLEVISPNILKQAETIKKTVPKEAAVVYLSQEKEYWKSRLWQRVLYPRPVFLLLGDDAQRESLNYLKKKYQVRYAICAGTPALDPDFAWYANLNQNLQPIDSLFFGELNP